MKPNLVVIQPPHIRLDAMIEKFCESFSESHYVYLVRPASVFREDSPAGVRFLNHPPDCLPRFGKVDAAIAVADPELAEQLKHCYPESRLALWDPREGGELPEEILSLLNPAVIRGEFGGPHDADLAEAI